MNKTNWIAIVNMAAGGGKTEKDWPVIEHYLKKHGIQYRTFFYRPKTACLDYCQE